LSARVKARRGNIQIGKRKLNYRIQWRDTLSDEKRNVHGRAGLPIAKFANGRIRELLCVDHGAMTAWTVETATLFAEALIRSEHPALAAYARDKYQRDGRGLISVSVRGPRPRPQQLQLRAVGIGYWPLETYRAFTAPHTSGPIRALADQLLARLATYDPTTQCVVAVVVGPEFLTIPFTLSLAAPVMLQEADGVH
jgi:hypothetical protein